METPGVTAPSWRQALTTNIEYVLMWVVALGFALPISFAFATGVYRILGISYTILWMIFLLPSTAMYLFVVVDALLLFAHKRPIVIPSVFEASARKGEYERARVHSVLSTWAELSFVANPMANLVLALLTQAMNWRRDAVHKLWIDAKQAAKQRRPLEASPGTEMAVPLVNHVPYVRGGPELFAGV